MTKTEPSREPRGVSDPFCIFFRTRAVVTVHQAGDVGLRLAGHQVGGTELLQHAVVLVLGDPPLVVDPRRRDGRRYYFKTSISIGAAQSKRSPAGVATAGRAVT